MKLDGISRNASVEMSYAGGSTRGSFKNIIKHDVYKGIEYIPCDFVSLFAFILRRVLKRINGTWMQRAINRAYARATTTTGATFYIIIYITSPSRSTISISRAGYHVPRVERQVEQLIWTTVSA